MGNNLSKMEKEIAQISNKINDSNSLSSNKTSQKNVIKLVQSSSDNTYSKVTQEVFSDDNIHTMLDILKKDRENFNTGYDRVKSLIEHNGVGNESWVQVVKEVVNNLMKAKEIVNFSDMQGTNSNLLYQLKEVYNDIIYNIMDYHKFLIPIQQSVKAENVNKLITQLENDFIIYSKILFDKMWFSCEKETQDFLNNSEKHNKEAYRVLNMIHVTHAIEEEYHIKLREIYINKISPIINECTEYLIKICDNSCDRMTSINHINNSLQASVTTDTINNDIMLKGMTVEQLLMDVD